MNAGHVFVDESKRRNYLLVASVVVPTEVTETRRALRDLVLPGQRRLHMKDESDSRKRLIAAAVTTSGASTTVYDAGRRYDSERDRRAACLRALVVDAAHRGDTNLIVEQDDSLLSWDKQRLIEYTREANCRETLRFEHRRAASELLLAIPDAVAWCWAKGGGWRRLVDTVVTEVHEV